jgi:hypothetical protein
MSNSTAVDDSATYGEMLRYFWEEHGDPTRYAEWDEARVEREYPAFFRAWKDYKAAREVIAIVAKALS